MDPGLQPDGRARPQEMLTHHLLDSPGRGRLLRDGPDRGTPSSVLDVGSGGGLPGVVMAICCPTGGRDLRGHGGQKAAFIQQVAALLALAEPAWRACRVESLAGPYDVVSARLCFLPDLVNWSAGRLGRAASGWP